MPSGPKDYSGIDPALLNFTRFDIARQNSVMRGCYITVIMTVVLSDPLPDAAVTTIGYVPAGVPVVGLSCWGNDPVEPHAARPATITNKKANKHGKANRRIRACRTSRPSPISKIVRLPNCSNGLCGQNPGGKLLAVTGECGVVVMVSVTVALALPAAMVADGVKDAAAPCGTPVAVSKTAFAVVAFAGTIIRPKVAGWPAGMESAGVCTFNLKSSTTTINAEVVPPPGAGLFTVTLSVPLWAKSLAVRAAFSDVELTNVVTRELPLTRTVELELKFVPDMLSVIAAFPAGTEEGERLLAPGTGLFTVKVVTTEGRPPGFATVTNGVPATAMAVAGMAACSCVALT